jgi:Zn-dependent M16 (insulinase) family peptidase
MRAFFAALLLCLSMNAFAADLAKLSQGDVVKGFKVTAIYLNDADQPMGARFVHRRSGFTLDLLRIESLPQAHTWVNSFPVSDQGEPHTQEHLLVGKGKTGRAMAGLDTMWLSSSSAFTGQWRTNYTLNTAAGSEVFFNLLDAQLNALLNPDYSDEEVRREVRNFGVTENADHTLRLEEKGSVYNEMTSSSTNPFRQLFRQAGHLVYGTHHALSYNAGGEPSGIRTMQPSDIRGFHDANYYLGNMGSVVALPPAMPLDDTLKRLDAMLTRLQGGKTAKPPKRMEELPKPEAAPAGTIVYGEYPNRNAQQPSPVAVIWPATRTLSAEEELLLNLFFDNVASDATSNLYKIFIDSKTRTLDVGAKNVGNRVSDELGHPVFVYLTDVTAPNLTNERLAAIRKAVVDELARVAAFKDGSPELAEFNKRIDGRVTELHRDLSKFVNSPPGFGFRNTGSAWMDQLVSLEKVPGFRKSLTLKPQLASVRTLLPSGKNIWRDDLAKWQITGADPYVVAAKPSPELLARLDAERAERSKAEAERLAKQYNVTDAQEAIKRYRADYDAGTVKIDTETAVKPARFVDQPPMTLDDSLQYRKTSLPGEVPLVASTFENMSSATAGIAFNLGTTPAEDYRYLSLLPILMTRVGVTENGKAVSFDDMTERLRNEILSLNANFSVNPRTSRAELVVRGAGNDLAESKRAVAWMRLVLEHPDWRVENLPRIRDAVDQALTQLRNTTQGPEEAWVQNPAESYRRQDSLLLLATNSFVTRAHNALRLKWMLKEAAPSDRDALTAWFTTLAGAAKDKTRADLKVLVAAKPPESLSPAARAIAADALRDLDLTLAEMPDESLAGDWAQLVNDMRDDLFTPPADVLARLEMARQHMLHASNARMFVIASTATQKELAAPIAGLVGALDQRPAPLVNNVSADRLWVDGRLRRRGAISDDAPVFVGLLAPNMNGGVIITSTPSVAYAQSGDREAQLDYLASRLYAGGGAHGIFLKTIGAGLAYSNGLRGSINGGRSGYYAERTPELPQTVKFVINELKNEKRDTTLADYAIAQAFGENRAGQTYEARGETMAADFADGLTPDQVHAFRQSMLDLRKDPDLGAKLFDRKNAVLAGALPGWSNDWKPAAGAVYVTIGPEKQLDAWDAYVKTFGFRLVRLYPRDFWM